MGPVIQTDEYPGCAHPGYYTSARYGTIAGRISKAFQRAGIRGTKGGTWTMLLSENGMQKCTGPKWVILVCDFASVLGTQLNLKYISIFCRAARSFETHETKQPKIA